jgi:AraC-like DNA-binding protein
MVFEVHKPCQALAHVVDNMVYYDGYRPNHSRERVLPDSGVYLIIDLKEDPKRIYDNISLRAIQDCHKSWVSGIQTGFLTIDAGIDSSMLVVKLLPTGAHLFLGLPLSELTDRVIAAELLLGSSINDLRDALLESSSPSRRFTLVEKYLTARAEQRGDVHQAVRFALQEIESRPVGFTINRVHFETGFSRKHLADLFGQWVGVTPKRYQRIIRFQKAIAEIETGVVPSWTALALDCGYFDQAHFINDFRHFCGMTPGEYVASRGEHLNYIPLP